MKTLFFILAIVGATNASAQKVDKKAAIKNMVESKNYVFHPNQALPLGGRAIQLTYDFDLKITPNSIISYLPYYGRAYDPPMDPQKGGLEFKSKNFDYTIVPGKKEGWDVTIKPKDYKDIQSLSLSISSAGYATLQVISVSKQAISFTGEITASN